MYVSETLASPLTNGTWRMVATKKISCRLKKEDFENDELAV